MRMLESDHQRHELPPRRDLRRGLFQRTVDVRENGVQVRAEAIDRRDDRQRDAGCDQTVFNRGRPRLIREKLPKSVLQSRLRNHLMHTRRFCRCSAARVRRGTAGDLKLH